MGPTETLNAPDAIKAFRGSILFMTDDPEKAGVQNSFQYFQDGVLVTENGLIIDVGEAEPVISSLSPDAEIHDYSGQLIIPGFIDTHIHYPQTGMIASYGEQLLDWLNNYTFPEEQKFADKTHSKNVSRIFLNELLRNGTTTALVFGTVHPESIDAFFEEAQARNLRMIAGKVMMDRNAPEALTDTAESSYEQSKALIERWHHKGRLHYAVTPRFAPTSTDQQLALAGKLLSEYPGLYMHTHLSENKAEIDWVKELFPDRSGYLDVYDHHQLLSERSVFAHGVHLCDSECQRLHDTGSAIAFCPTSNLFLGSGLFDLKQAEKFDVNVGLGTDIGAGTSFSMLQTLNEAYKVMQLQSQKLDPWKSLYLATLGGAKSLRLEDKIGSFNIGSEADFIVIDEKASPLLEYRMSQTQSLEEQLFVLMTLGDDRAVEATYSMSECVYRKEK